MANDYYRKSAVLEVGGFDEEMHVMEDRDILWRIEKAGYKILLREIAFLHHRSVDRFTLRFILGNAFTYGYYWHKLSHMHSDRIGFSAIPIKIVAFAVLGLGSYFYLPILWILLASMTFWFFFRFYRDRTRVNNCIAHMKGKIEKIGALIYSFLVHILFEISEELGKLYGMIY
jgi:cellulose synthase/poly-beta-1,6-N-acetylglucosamine synthase-like glycosyltransferase